MMRWLIKDVGDDGDMSTVRDEKRVFEELMHATGECCYV